MMVVVGKWTDPIAVLKVEMSGLAVGMRSKMVPRFGAPMYNGWWHSVRWGGLEEHILEQADSRALFQLYSV